MKSRRGIMFGCEGATGEREGLGQEAERGDFFGDGEIEGQVVVLELGGPGPGEFDGLPAMVEGGEGKFEGFDGFAITTEDQELLAPHAGIERLGGVGVHGGGKMLFRFDRLSGEVGDAHANVEFC